VASSCKCGVKGSQRIVGGEVAQPGEWPWIVVHSHGVTDGSQQGGCGGTLVADNWVVTAAHCFYDNAGTQVVFANTMSVVIGEHTIRTAQGSNILSDNDEFDTTLKRKNLEIETMIIHENYKSTEQDHDIALLKLKEKLDLSVYMPACLPPAGKSWVDSAAWVYGWGTLFSGAEDISYILRETSQTIISNTACEQGSGMINSTNPDTGVTSLVSASMQGTLTDNMLCGEKAGKDSCQGDSGGPFTVEESGQHQLAGVVSWGLGCAAAGLAGVYSDVSSQRAWIDTQFAANGGTPKFCAP